MARNNRASEDIIDAQNREITERLGSKTAYLKSLAFDMEMEAKDHHKLLDNLDGDFESTSGFLGGTMTRLKVMMGSGRSNRKLMCYIAVGVVGVIFFLYFALKRLTASSPSTGSAVSHDVGI